MPAPRRVGSSGSGLGTNIADILGSLDLPSGGGSSRGGSARGGATPGGGQDLSAALAEIRAQTAAARSIGDGGGGGFGSVAGAGKDALFGVLGALDKGRATILSVGEEVGSLVEGEGFSLRDLKTNIDNNYQFSDFLVENVAQSESWNPVVKGAVSFAADVLMDPLTYLAPPAKLAQMGARGTATRLLKATDDDLLKHGLTREAVDATAAKVARTRSSSVLSDAERRLLDVGERGVYWNAPGTGTIGRRLKIDKAIDGLTGGRYGLSQGERLYAKQARLGGGLRLSKAHENAMKPVAWAMNSRLTRQATMAGMDGSDALLKVWVRSGDPDLVRKGIFGLESRAQGRGIAKVTALDIESKGQALINRAKKAGVSMEDLASVPQGSKRAYAAVAAVDQQLADDTLLLFDDIRATVNQKVKDLGGRDWLKGLDDYGPRIATDDAKAVLGKGKKRPGGISGNEIRRQYGVAKGQIDTLLGHKLVAPSAHPQGYSVEEQMARIITEASGGALPGGWFESAADKAWPTYFKIIAKRTGDEATAALLVKHGIGVDEYGTLATTGARAAARNSAVRTAEATRRLKRVAVGEARVTGSALRDGEVAAKASDDAAQAATSDARAKASAARSVVGKTEHPGVEAIREYGEFHAGLARDARATVARYVADTRPVLDRTATEMAAMRLESIALRTAQRDVSRRGLALVERRAALYNDLHKAWTIASDRKGLVSVVTHMEKEIDRLTAEIASVNDMMDDIVQSIAPSARASAEIEADLGAIVTKQRSLAGQKSAAKRKGDHALVVKIDRELDTNRNLRRALRLEASTGKRIEGESAELLQMGQDEITKFTTRVTELRQAAAEAGRDDLAMSYGRLVESLPRWDATTERLASPHGGTDWFHGTRSPMNVVGTPNAVGEKRMTDSLGGIQFTDHAKKVAREYSGGADLVATAELRITNPMVFPKVPDPEWQHISDPSVVWKFGTDMGQAKVEMAAEFAEHGIRSGTLTSENLADGITELLQQGGKYELDADELEAILTMADNVIADVADGIPYRQALSDEFSYSEFDPLSWGRLRAHWSEAMDGSVSYEDLVVPERFAGDPMSMSGLDMGAPPTAAELAAGGARLGSDQRVGNYMTTQLDFTIDPTVRQSVMDGWKADHSQYDGVLYSYGRNTDESWAAFPFSPTQIHSKTPRVMRDLVGVRDRMDRLLTQAARAKQKAAWEADEAVTTVTLDMEQAAKRANSLDRKIVKAEAKAAKQRATLGAKGVELLDIEMGHWKAAQKAFDSADEVQQRFVQAQMDEAQRLGVDAKDLYDVQLHTEARNAAQIHMLEGQHQAALGDLARVSTTDAIWSGIAKDMVQGELRASVEQALADGFKQFGANTLIPGEMVDVFSAATRMMEPDFLKGVFKAFDGVQNLWKGYATMSPGFMWRNYLGGVWNNYLADIDSAAYRHYFNMEHGRTRRVPAAYREAYDAGVKAGAHTGGHVSAEVAAHSNSHLGVAARLNPASTDFAPIAGVRRGSEAVENRLRMSLFMDRYVKSGGDVGEAVTDVAKYHFDYGDLSKLERDGLRRAVPFYTWTRKNLPLQLEMLARKPAKFNRFTQAKANVEYLSEEEGVVPSFYGENMAIRLPWRREGGNVYYFPDLPFTGISDSLDPGIMLGQVSPFIRTPVELWAGKQMWNDIDFQDEPTPVPTLVTAIPGLMPALQQVGWASHTADGQWSMKDRHLYALTNWMPTFGQARRLMPKEDRYQERHLTSLLSFMGAGLRTNSTASQQGIVTGAYMELKAELERLQAEGYISTATDRKYANEPQDLNWQGDAATKLIDTYDLNAEAAAQDENKLSFGNNN